MITVGTVAELAHVTVRTLHHYDEIGLLRPSNRSPAGYRLYDEADLDRLFAILSYRELGFGLDDIAALLDDERPMADHLRAQRKLLTEQRHRLDDMLHAIDKALEAEKMGSALTPEEKFELFGDWVKDEEAYATEAEERWGDTEAWRQSQRRVARYTKDDWKQIQQEGAEVERHLAAAVSSDADPAGDTGREISAAHRAQIQKWFYDVSDEIHRGLAQMYVDDTRFTAYYEKVAPGAAEWLRDAIHAHTR